MTRDQIDQGAISYLATKQGISFKEAAEVFAEMLLRRQKARRAPIAVDGTGWMTHQEAFRLACKISGKDWLSDQEVIIVLAKRVKELEGNDA